MTNEKLNQARAEHAWSEHYKNNPANPTVIAARLAREGWTPPVVVVVDPDLAKANRLYETMDWPKGLKGDTAECYIAFIREGIKLGRELERADLQPKEDIK